MSLRRCSKPKVKKLLSFISPLQALADVAKAYGLTSSFDLYEAIDNLQANIGDAEKAVDGTLQKLSAYFRANPGKKAAFDRLVYKSTRVRMHPYKGSKPPAKDVVGRKDWDDMQKDVTEIGLAGEQTYRLLENAYIKQSETLQEAVLFRINNLKSERVDENGNVTIVDVSSEVKAKLRADIMKRLFDRSKLEPYFPLTRRGDLWLEFVATDPGTGENPDIVKMSFSSYSARNKFVAELENDPTVDNKTINRKSRAEVLRTIGSSPSTAFASETLSILQAGNVSKDVEEQFMNLFLDALPESAFAKSFTRRGNEGAGTTGFDQDAESAFRQKAFNTAVQTERMKSGAEIDRVVVRLQEEYETLQEKSPLDAENARIILNELVKRAKFAKAPPSDKVAAMINRGAFLGTLGFNVSSALVNLSQIPLMMYPILGGEYGYRETHRAIRDATLAFGGSGTTRKIPTIGSKKSDVETKGMWSIDNYFDTDEAGNLLLRPEILQRLDPSKLEGKARKEMQDK